MLDWMRKNAGSWLVKVVLGAIVVVFVFWGIGSWRSQKQNQVAMVNERVITVEQYRRSFDRLVDQMRQSFGNRLDEKTIEALNIKGQALNQLIDQALLMGEADRLGLRVSDAQLAEAIAKVPVFQNNGVFDRRRYETLLQRNRLTPEQFEASQREAMLLEKLRTLLASAIKVSEAEARAFYEWNNAQVKMDHVLFEPGRYPQPPVAADDVRAHFEASKERYKNPEMIRVRFLHFSPQALIANVSLSETDLQAYYDEHPDEFRVEKTVEARHILIRVNDKAPEDQVEAARAKIVDILEAIRKGEDFAALAKTHSEDTTKENGGYLGAFGRRAMIQPFADQAFALQEGQVSEPVRTPFGWHLIKVEKINPETVKPFEQAKQALKERLSLARAKTMAFDEAEAVLEALEAEPDMEKIASARQLKVQETDFFTRQDGPAGTMADPQQFAAAAFALEANRISDIVDFGDGYYLIQAMARKAAAVPDLAAVEAKVRADLAAQRQDEQAQKDAQALIKLLKDGAPLAEAAQQMGQKVTPAAGFFKRNEPVPGIGSEASITAAVFALTEDQPIPAEPVKGAKGYYVLHLVERKAPEAQAFAAEKDAVIARLSQQKEDKAFETLLEDVKSRSRISIAEAYRF
jgi:peptidyl-prolyl cis-trans isomerase D